MVYYSDAGGSQEAALGAVAGGARDGAYVCLESARAAGTASTPYVADGVPIEGTGTTTMTLAGSKWETIEELGGVRQIEITAAQQGPPADAAGAVSYRVWVDVEPVP